MPEETTSSLAEVASEILLMLGHDPRAAGAGIVSIDALRKCTREQLIEYARRLGLSGVAKLNKDMLAGRIQSALDPRIANSRTAEASDGDPTGDDAPPEGSTESGLAPFPEKFDLGPDSQEEPTPHHIPWSYGQNRVTAMVVDPEQMFAYWECTDGAIEAARRGLGRGGRRRLAQPARLRRHRPPVRRHQRAQLLRSQGRTLGSPVVLRHRQADLGGVRRAGAEVGGGLLRQDRPLGSRRVPAPRAGRRARSSG